MPFSRTIHTIFLIFLAFALFGIGFSATSCRERGIESKLSEPEAIRLAAECISKAEPNVDIDVKSAIALYYRNSRVYRSQSLWLVGFPYHRAGAQKETHTRERSQNIKAFRMVWVEEDGSYSGNTMGELPPTNPPMSLSPDDQARAIALAEDFVRRHNPELDITPRPPTATYYADTSAFGGGPLWIVGFAVPAPRDKSGQIIGVRPFFSKAIWVKPDGLVVDGPICSP